MIHWDIKCSCKDWYKTGRLVLLHLLLRKSHHFIAQLLHCLFLLLFLLGWPRTRHQDSGWESGNCSSCPLTLAWALSNLLGFHHVTFLSSRWKCTSLPEKFSEFMRDLWCTLQRIQVCTKKIKHIPFGESQKKAVDLNLENILKGRDSNRKARDLYRWQMEWRKKAHIPHGNKELLEVL